MRWIEELSDCAGQHDHDVKPHNIKRYQEGNENNQHSAHKICRDKNALAVNAVDEYAGD